jgi:kynurenine formamidase
MLMKNKAIGVLLLVMLVFPAKVVAQEKPALWKIVEELQSKTFVDLTHSFQPGIPHWPGFDDEERITIYYYDEGIGKKGAGFLAHQYTIPGQWGTHVDPPAHFVKGKRFIDDIPVKEMILPMVVIDVSAKAQQDPDYQVSMDDIRAWEARYGQIPENSFVALRTDWSKRWPDKQKMRNADSLGTAHYPGWSQPVLTYLYENRNITASGHETTDTDPGIATSKDDYSLETYILSRDKFQIELMTNLDRVPECGAIAVVTFPKPQKGSGFPARVFAIVP